MKRRGFTLLEVMIASAVSTVVAASLCSLFIGLHRLIKLSYAEAQISLALRAEREKILFRTMTEGGNALWSGLLSAQDQTLKSSGLGYTAVGFDISNGTHLERVSQTYSDHEVDSTFFQDHLCTFMLEKTIDGETRRERVVVPLFGYEQTRNSLGIFHDNKK